MLCLYDFPAPYNAFQHYRLMRCGLHKVYYKHSKGEKKICDNILLFTVYEHKVNKQYVDEHSVCTEVKGVRHTF